MATTHYGSVGFNNLTAGGLGAAPNASPEAPLAPVVMCGTGVPTVVAPKGSLYLRSDGTSTSTRAYINTDGSTAWTAITTAA
jgi:hypothetical protein